MRDLARRRLLPLAGEHLRENIGRRGEDDLVRPEGAVLDVDHGVAQNVLLLQPPEGRRLLPSAMELDQRVLVSCLVGGRDFARCLACQRVPSGRGAADF